MPLFPSALGYEPAFHQDFLFCNALRPHLAISSELTRISLLDMAWELMAMLELFNLELACHMHAISPIPCITLFLCLKCHLLQPQSPCHVFGLFHCLLKLIIHVTPTSHDSTATVSFVEIILFAQTLFPITCYSYSWISYLTAVEIASIAFKLCPGYLQLSLLSSFACTDTILNSGALVHWPKSWCLNGVYIHSDSNVSCYHPVAVMTQDPELLLTCSFGYQCYHEMNPIWLISLINSTQLISKNDAWMH